MSDETWIEVVGWDKFQHYRTRNPPWIKNYLTLLANPEYRRTPYRQRGILHGIWLLYAASGGEVPWSPAFIAHHLGFPSEWEQRRARREGGESVARAWRESHQGGGEDTVRGRDLKALERRGFITKRASKPLARASTDASPEGEVLRTSPKSALARAGEGAPAASAQREKPPPPPPCPDCGVGGGLHVSDCPSILRTMP